MTSWRDGETTLAQVQEALAAFNAERDWEQFHTPKDLAMQVSVEAAELLELFLWKTADDPVADDRAREELADVFLTLVNLSSKLGVDLMAAAEAKLARNAERYPVELARGRAEKWDALRAQQTLDD